MATTINDVLEFVGRDTDGWQDRALQALEEEEARDGSRATLVSQLKDMLGIDIDDPAVAAVAEETAPVEVAAVTPTSLPPAPASSRPEPRIVVVDDTPDDAAPYDPKTTWFHVDGQNIHVDRKGATFDRLANYTSGTFEVAPPFCVFDDDDRTRCQVGSRLWKRLLKAGHTAEME